MATLAQVLAKKRKEYEWSFRDAEKATGINNAHLVQIENGTIARPSPTVLYALAEGYGLEYEELMRLAGHLEPARDARVGVALRALHGLSPEKQDEAVKYLLRMQRNDRADRTK